MMLLLDLPSECIDSIASYATPNDLCALDATCRRFGQHVTDKVWAQQAQCAYGIESCPGKEAWRKGKALTDTERGFHCVFQIEPEGVSLCQSTSMSCGSQVIVAASDGWESVNDGEPNSFEGDNPLVLRDTKTLKQRAILSPNDNYWKPVVGGLPGREVIGIVYENDNARFAVAQEGGYYREYSMRELFPQHSGFFLDNNFLGINMLGSPNHLVLSSENSSHLYLVKFNGSLPLSETNQITPVRALSTGGGNIHSIERGGEDLPAGTFVVDQNGGDGERKLSVWRLDDSTSGLILIQTIVHKIHREYNEIAVSTRYIVGCLFDFEEENEDGTTYHVFDRSLGNKVAELKESTSDYRIFNPQMHIIGGLLVTTTCSKPRGDIDHLRVWNLSTGTSHCVPRGTGGADSEDITSMVKIDGDGYTCFFTHQFDHGVATIWGFPESEQGLHNLQEVMKHHTYVSGPRQRSSQKRKRENGNEDQCL